MRAELSAIYDLLLEVSAQSALVGGLAVSARAEPRFTRDIDLALSVDSDEQAELLIRNFIEKGYKLFATLEQTSVDRLATVRLLQPGGSEEEVVVDLLFASSGIEKEIVEMAEPIFIFPDLKIPVASTGHLIATKVLSCDRESRSKDYQDLHALISSASEEDIRLAEASLELIIRRGFDRSKDLKSIFRGLKR